ncbi:MBL fold metallo-hydrolase [Roseateles sp.]|uniref:MBL fold metallo-hydrolase n=1 Tax=Roseateles sp. TaxID=1971397 RepID=UPI0031D2FE96
MEFKVLSHASLLVKQGGASILMDPWLLGSCYWRSWWNFPEPVFDQSELAAVDAVVISHVHWDHWHGPTLKKLLRGKRIIVPDEPGLRSAEDLQAIGFKDVVRLPHGKPLKIGDLTLTMYQFGRYLNDAAIVVEGGGTVLLNANDAKIAGAALQNIVNRHGKIDFAFRSHSSANARVCFKVIGDESFVADDREHYFRSFQGFMDAVKPRHAVPFASNHCHLHDDVYGMNGYISNPLQLREYCDRAPNVDWKLQVMMPGSTWSSERGFSLRPETEFENLKESLSAYREKVSATLVKYTEQENAVKINDRMVERFMEYFKAKGRPAGCAGDLTLTVRWPDGRRQSYDCHIDTQTFEVLPEERGPQAGLPVIEMPAIVFRDAVVKNMFHHAGISKRCLYIAANQLDMDRLVRIVGFLDNYELGVFPKRWAYQKRLYGAYVRRWRELFVYAHALWLLKVRKKPMYLVEEAILRGEF